MKTSNSYDARQVDIELLQTVAYPQGITSVNLTLTEADAGISRYVTGVQKLAQRYTVMFLTALGSNKSNSEDGSEFAQALVSNRLSTRGQIVHYFALSNTRIIQRLRAEDADPVMGGQPPDDERLDSAELLGYEIDVNSATVKLRIKLTTMAGTNTVFVIPATRI